MSTLRPIVIDGEGRQIQNQGGQNNFPQTSGPQPIIITRTNPNASDGVSCTDGTYIQRHVEKGGNQKEFHVCIKKPALYPCLNVEHRDLYSEQLIRLDQGLDILDRNGLNYNLEIDINHETIFQAHMAKLLSKSGYFFDSVVNFRPNYDFENSRIEVKNPEITSDVFSSLLDLIYYRTVKTCQDGLRAIGRAAQILDMAEVVKACQELQNPASVQQQQQQQEQQQGPPPAPDPSSWTLHPQQQQDQNVFPPNAMPFAGPAPFHGDFLMGPHQLHSGHPGLPAQQPPACVRPPAPHHHHPIPQTKTCQPKHCCQSHQCGHCTTNAACERCEERPEDPPAARPVPICCQSDDLLCGENPQLRWQPRKSRGSNNQKRDRKSDNRCLPCPEDGTPPCKGPLQLLFDAMDKGANEQFHESYNNLMDNFVQISLSAEFLNLNHHQLRFVLASDSLCVPEEAFLFRAVMRWIQFDVATRLAVAAKVLAAIRFPLMTWEQLKEVQSEPLLANDIDVHELLKPAFAFIRVGKEKAKVMGNKFPRNRVYDSKAQ